MVLDFKYPFAYRQYPLIFEYSSGKWDELIVGTIMSEMKVSRKLSTFNADHHGSFLKLAKLLLVKKSCCRSWTAAERWLSHPSFQGQALQKVKSAACVFVLCHLMGGVGMCLYIYIYIYIYVIYAIR